MKTIWKYKLQTTDYQEVEMPSGATILTVQTQNGEPCIWCLCNPNNLKQFRGIRIIGTGHEKGYIEGSYIGTYQLHSYQLVFHVFETTI